MSCQTYQTDVLEAYLRDQLPAGERAALEAHIATCADCRRRIDELQRLIGGLRAIGRREMKREIAEQAARIRAGHRRTGYPWMQAAAVFLVVSFITSYWYVFHLSSPSEALQTQQVPAVLDETIYAAEESADGDDLVENVLTERERESKLALPPAAGRRTRAAGKATEKREVARQEGVSADRPPGPLPAETAVGQSRGDIQLAAGEEPQDSLAAGSSGAGLRKSRLMAAELPAASAEEDKSAEPLLYQALQRDSNTAQDFADHRYYQNTAESFAVAERGNQIQLYQGKSQLNITMMPAATTLNETRKKRDAKDSAEKEKSAVEWPDSFDVQIERPAADQIEMIWLGTTSFQMAPLNTITVVWLSDSLYRVTVHDSLSYQIKPSNQQFRAFRER